MPKIEQSKGVMYLISESHTESDPSSTTDSSPDENGPTVSKFYSTLERLLLIVD